ncbi:unnamed protein product [Acanthoscelides obtectus]|uniref:Uncharacterized protein n=1 Tax=Acanthoscelides obtectus TaxID=200917 RepID=A0A9P0LUB5_ACAOB|nr:unnamed protein product [Acanthoscelides obtectus]CAK1641087.1 hypothetical protein AOBTE_LOCUS12140 [Acanthoscelides obtectus]
MNPNRKINRLCFGSLLNEAWGKSATQPNGVAGFRSCGVIPFNPHAVPDYAFLKLDDIHENEPRNIANSNAPAQIDEVISPERSVLPQPGCSTWDLPRTPPRSGGFVQQPEINREIAENNNSQITPGKMLDQISPIPIFKTKKRTRSENKRTERKIPETANEKAVKKESMNLKVLTKLKEKYLHLDDEEEVSDENEAVCVGCDEPDLLTKKV